MIQATPNTNKIAEKEDSDNITELLHLNWLIRNWEEINKISINSIKNKPNKEWLALIISIGHIQTNEFKKAKDILKTAIKWGLPKKVAIKNLIGGFYSNTAEIYRNQKDKNRERIYLERYLSVTGNSENEAYLAACQYKSLELIKVCSYQGKLTKKYSIIKSIADYKEFSTINSANFAKRVTFNLHKKASDSTIKIPDAELTCINYKEKKFYFSHFFGDFIPKKMALNKSFYEQAFLESLVDFHQPGLIIVDGGANIGNHSIFFASVMNAITIAFEPHPWNYEFLIANRELNNLEHLILPKQIALGEKPDTARLELTVENNYGTASTIPKENIHEKDSFEISVSTLDTELFKLESQVSILKLDVEGMELSVLKGATHIIKTSLPLITVECFKRRIFNEISNFLNEFGYIPVDSANPTPTFTFINKKNEHHMKVLSQRLEKSSISKIKRIDDFNQ